MNLFIAGAHNESAALLAVQDAVKSKTPVLGYTVTYAVANILLTGYAEDSILLSSVFYGL